MTRKATKTVKKQDDNTDSLTDAIWRKWVTFPKSDTKAAIRFTVQSMKEKGYHL